MKMMTNHTDSHLHQVMTLEANDAYVHPIEARIAAAQEWVFRHGYDSNHDEPWRDEAEKRAVMIICFEFYTMVEAIPKAEGVQKPC